MNTPPAHVRIRLSRGLPWRPAISLALVGLAATFAHRESRAQEAGSEGRPKVVQETLSDRAMAVLLEAGDTPRLKDAPIQAILRECEEALKAACDLAAVEDALGARLQVYSATDQWHQYVRDFARLASVARTPEPLAVPLVQIAGALSFEDLERPGTGVRSTTAERFGVVLEALDMIVERFANSETADGAVLASAQVLLQADRRDEALGLLRRLAKVESKSDASQMARALLWEETNARAGQAFPEQSWTDAAGKAVRLRDSRGRVVVLYCWFAACGPCVHEIEEMKKAVKDWGAEVVLIGLNYDSKKEVSTKAVERLTPPGPQVIMCEQPPAAVIPVRAFPRAFVIDKNGKVIGTAVGFDSLAKLVGEARAAK